MGKEDKLNELMEQSRQLFLDEGRDNLNQIMITLLNYRLYGRREEGEELERYFHSLKGTAATLQFKRLSDIGEEYADFLNTVNNSKGFSERVFVKLLDGLAKVHESLEELSMHGDKGMDKESKEEEKKYINAAVKANILIMDEDTASVNMLEKELCNEGYYVLVSSDVSEIDKILEEARVDLILLDFLAVKKAGFGLLEKLKNADNSIPIIFLFSNLLSEDESRVLKAVADNYISKPLKTEEVFIAVENTLKKVDEYKNNTMIDSLTGAYTKQYFNQRINKEKESLVKKEGCFSVAVLDINDIKQINQSYGYQAGDFVLQNFVKLLRKNLRETDEIYRLGGGEFLVLLPDIQAEESYNLMKEARDSVIYQKLNYKEGNVDISCTFNVGIASIENKDEDADNILSKANQALKQTKDAETGIIIYIDKIGFRGKAKKKILLVDDVSVIVHLMQTHLSTMGYGISCARDGEEGIRKCKEFNPDLMIVDLMLPKVDGFEVCRQIKSNPETRDTKIIIVSSKNKKEDVLKCFEIGVDDYMIKPFSMMELEQRIEKLL